MKHKRFTHQTASDVSQFFAFKTYTIESYRKKNDVQLPNLGKQKEFSTLTLFNMSVKTRKMSIFELVAMLERVQIYF